MVVDDLMLEAVEVVLPIQQCNSIVDRGTLIALLFLVSARSVASANLH